MDQQQRRRALRAGNLNMDVQVSCANEHASSGIFAVIG
jgi:hypothetical protein